MSTGAVSAILYACTFSTPTSLGAVPEDSEAKPHHVEGKYRNPWPSYREWGVAQIMRTMAWQVEELNPLVFSGIYSIYMYHIVFGMS